MRSRLGFITALLLVAVLPAVIARTTPRRTDVPPIRPTIPTADRTGGNRVFLEHAELLKKNPEDSFMILVGDVVFTKGPMIMKCDSAHYFAETESMNAFGNVSMEQGDTLFVYADELDYNGLTELAILYGDSRPVRLINRDVELQTDVFNYDLGIDLGYYTVGGTLTDPSNTLNSQYGEYAPSTKEANFYTGVHLNSRNTTDTLDIYSDTLYYNTVTHIAELHSPSRVINARGTIYTSLGVYDTDSNRTTLFDRSTIVTAQGPRLTADTIFYDRNAGYGEAFGRMVLVDSAHSAELHADYGFYDEKADSSFSTGNARILEYSKGDTLFMHGRYIQTTARVDTTVIPADTVAGTEQWLKLDTTHVAVIFPRVRFFRSDLQGVADSMRFTEADSALRMYINPVVWNENQQVFGNIIECFMNDSTIERAVLPDQGFTAQHIEDDLYNQLAGKEMVAHFVSGEMNRLDINGNVQIIMFPEESDSTINKVVNAESSFLTAYFKGRTTEKVKMWPQTNGTATPLFIARRSIFFLPKFRWYEDMRPTSPEDIFTVPPAQEALMAEAGRGIPEIHFKKRLYLLHERPDGLLPEPLPGVPAVEAEEAGRAAGLIPGKSVAVPDSVPVSAGPPAAVPDSLTKEVQP